MNREEISKKIEAVLFFKGEPVSKSALARMLEVSSEELSGGLEHFKEAISGRGVKVIENGDFTSLGTAPEVGEIIERLSKEELEKDLSKASVETLSIILYQGPVGRNEIDFIRGVNSAFILRNLLIKGLIEKTVHPQDRRTFLYSASTDLLSHLGITSLGDLPEFEEVRGRIKTFKEHFEAEADTKE
jgi:segregation and condensation protein B